MECAAIQDILMVGNVLDRDESREHKLELDRIAAMLSRLGGRGYGLKEGSEAYGFAATKVLLNRMVQNL